MDSSYDMHIDRMLEISRKKYILLQDMLALTKNQAGAINEDGLEDLQKLIDEKQKCIEKIDRLDEEFNVYFRRFKSVMGVSRLSELDASGVKGARELQDVTGEILNLIREIGELEKLNNIKAENLFNHFGNEIKKINLGKKMNSVYVPKQQNPPAIYFDKKK